MWNGQYWVRVRPDQPLVASVPAADPGLWELQLDQRGYYPGKVILAATVGLTFSYLRLSVPIFDAGPSSLLDLLFFNLLLGAITYALIVVILSLGPQGIDVLILRGSAAGALMGAGVGLLTPVYQLSVALWLVWIAVSAMIGAIGGIPSLAAPAALLNLLWYQSFRSLRPQLPFLQPRRPGA